MGNFELYGKAVGTVFQLLPSNGQHEDDMSRAVGWALARCPIFLSKFVAELFSVEIDPELAFVRCQRIDPSSGRTDVEIEVPGVLHVIIEAKRGWELPTLGQLQQYAGRTSNGNTVASHVVMLTDCGGEYAAAHTPATSIGDIPVSHLSWSDLSHIAKSARTGSTIKQRYLLDELLDYLKGVITLERTDSNRVYVVALSAERLPGWGISWIEVVTKKHRYFHPVGGAGFPAAPVNYIAFRYYGELQSIHHVEDYVVVDDIHKDIPEVPAGAVTTPHFVYRLGPAFRPDHQVRTGKVYANGRKWCMLDTLFTAKTIAEASQVSNERQARALEQSPR